jgi:hypothetical protein
MEILHKIPVFFKSLSPFVLGAVIFVLVAILSFGLGRLSAQEDASSKMSFHKEGLITDNCPEFLNTAQANVSTTENEEVNASLTSEGLLVGSKNSDKYHFPWCSGALRIKDENKIWFTSMDEAREAGYLPAGNCKGLE